MNVDDKKCAVYLQVRQWQMVRLVMKLRRDDKCVPSMPNSTLTGKEAHCLYDPIIEAIDRALDIATRTEVSPLEGHEVPGI